MIAASTSPRARPRLGGVLLRTQPDGRLAQLAAEGSETAFEEIVRRHRAGLVGFAARIASRDSADDVVQDSMVKAHAALLRGDRPGSVRAWLFAIVRNTALNDLRDRPVHQPLDESHDGVEQPPETADRRRRLRDLVQAIANLPATQQRAIVGRELEGKGHDEIARELQISPGAVRQLIFRARSALRATAGCLLPMHLLRAAMLSGTTEGAGTAAVTGSGLAAKLAVGAIVTTGALVAGTNAVNHETSNVDRHGAAQVTLTRQPKTAHLAVERTSTTTAGDRRERVVVAPKVASLATVSTPAAHTPTSRPQNAHPSPGAQGGNPQPPPGGSTEGGGGSASPGAEQRSGGGAIAQTSSAPSGGDCKQDTERDPAPGAVSPG